MSDVKLQSYYYEGITDGEIQRQGCVEFSKNNDCRTIMHHHPHAEECLLSETGCEVYENGEKVNTE